MSELSKVYNQAEIEEKWYRIWEENGYFSPDYMAGGKKKHATDNFVIVIPPPNVTGSLHMGHALDNTLQDILIRFKRMQGYRTLWVPGTDHAGIATQNVVEKELAKEKKKKEDIGREEFLKRVWSWKEKFGGTITKQLRRLGASCDWKRERFTMDEGLSHAVRKAFVTLYEEGLIYKGKRMVNWCPRCKTAISDIEVEHENKKASLWYIKYPVERSKEFIVVATTRPETMLGDTAVAVNPDDERYKHLIGKVLDLPLVNRKIPVIKDSFVDPSFGTGAVKVTPAHDPNDFEIGMRHNLPKINIFTKEAKIDLGEFDPGETGNLRKYEGLDRSKAREEIVKDLEERGLLEKIEDHENNIGRCYRCKTVIEPYLSDQWFVKVAPLAEKAIKAVESGDIIYTPDRWQKVYLDWMINLKDWCISRQIWWGHRIPVWYCDCGAVIVAEEDPKSCPDCNSGNIVQDNDVLDTWFSSSLWPFSTLGWPEMTKDLEEYYPTSVLVTGYDIITFWVSKMIMMGLKFMDKKPFGKIYIHGLIRDLTGKKMSKSLGNVIDPLEVIDRVGADALRFSLTSLVTSGGQDLKLSDEKITEGRNFANKIWNVSRFVLMQGEVPDTCIDENSLEIADKWILSKYNKTVKQITSLLEEFEFGEAARCLYEFIWSELCDWYVEMSKQSLYVSETGQESINPKKENTLKVLRTVLNGTMRLLHPFMPFETEEIFQMVNADKDIETIMLSNWPIFDQDMIDKKTEEKMDLVIEVIRAIRNIRAEMNIQTSKEINIIISAGAQKAMIEGSSGYIMSLTKAGMLDIQGSVAEKPAQSASAVVSAIEIFVPLEGLIDFEKELARLEKASVEMDNLIRRVDEKLSNADFVGRAKPELVEQERAKLNEYKNKKRILEDRIKTLKK